MKSNDHLIGELEHLGVYLTAQEVNQIVKAVKRDKKENRIAQKEKVRLAMIDEHKPQEP